MVLKTREDTGCNLELAIAWSLGTKNTLHIVNGCSPNQLVFGQKPNVPSVLIKKLRILEGEAAANNLNAMQAARKSIIQVELSSEKIERVLCQKMRLSTTLKYRNGNLVYFKNKPKYWIGPETQEKTKEMIVYE